MMTYNLTKKLLIIKNDSGTIIKAYAGAIAETKFKEHVRQLFENK
jgi:hypothetical protein